MAIRIKGQEFLSYEEQVLKNKKDIEKLKELTKRLESFSKIKIHDEMYDDTTTSTTLHEFYVPMDYIVPDGVIKGFIILKYTSIYESSSEMIEGNVVLPFNKIQDEGFGEGQNFYEGNYYPAYDNVYESNSKVNRGIMSAEIDYGQLIVRIDHVRGRIFVGTNLRIFVI